MGCNSLTYNRWYCRALLYLFLVIKESDDVGYWLSRTLVPDRLKTADKCAAKYQYGLWEFDVFDALNGQKEGGQIIKSVKIGLLKKHENLTEGVSEN